MKKPSVVFINRVYPPVRGATGRVLRDLAQSFVADGWDVTVITSGKSALRKYDKNIRIIRVKALIRSKTIAGYARVWGKLFFAGLLLPKKDLIVTMTDPPLLVVAGRILAIFKRSRHIHWCQDLYPDLLPTLGLNLPAWLMKFFKALSRRTMKRCDKVVVVGRCMAKNLIHSGLQARNIAVIPNWPDYELLGPITKKKRKVSRNTAKKIKKIKGSRPFAEQLPDRREPKFRVLYSGNLGRTHPIKTILDAAQILNKDCPDIEFTFVGDGPNFDYLAQERAKRNLENIRLLPYQPAHKLKSLMESGDIHLITMKHEAEGLIVPCKLYSALAVGRPCILVGPAQSETARIIRDFHAGSVVPQGKAKLLANTIKDYRLNSETWFNAHEGAVAAGETFGPHVSIMAWIKRARIVADLPEKEKKVA